MLEESFRRDEGDSIGPSGRGRSARIRDDPLGFRMQDLAPVRALLHEHVDLRSHAMPKTLKTGPSVWSSVFRRIVQQLESDPDLQRVVGLPNLRSWKGVAGDKAPFAPSSTAPVVRLTPMPASVDWYSPDTQAGTLRVLVEIAVQSLCIDDVADLWDLIVQTLRPCNGTLVSDLVALGAETGEIVFADPAFDAQPAAQPEGQFKAVGRFELRLLRSVNP